MRSTCLLLTAMAVFAMSCSHKTVATASPVQPPATWTPIPANVPVSEINIPIRIYLQPLYQMAEKYVDREFSSPGWPNDWIYDGCNTRYMYHFRRGPLQLSVSGRNADLDFTCYYKVKGAQRGCIGGVGVTPWSPPCSCGIGEPERRIQIGFHAEFFVRNNYTVGANITVKEPKTPDPCEVCFFKSDITSTIVKNVKPQLDTAKLAVSRQIGAVSLLPQMQKLWTQLQQPVPLAGYGYLNINPELITLNRLSATNSYLDIAVGLTARPHAGFEYQPPVNSNLPFLQGGVDTGGFRIYADASLTYDSLNNILSKQLAGMHIEGDKGLMKKKYVDVEDASVMAGASDRLTLKIKVKGSLNGTVFLTGKPMVDTATGKLTVEDLDYDISTKNFLVNTADWMLNRKITKRLQDAARFEMSQYIARLQASMTTALNRAIAKGISTTGQISRLTVTEILPQQGFLFVRMYAAGEMNVIVSEFNL